MRDVQYEEGPSGGCLLTLLVLVGIMFLALEMLAVSQPRNNGACPPHYDTAECADADQE